MKKSSLSSTPFWRLCHAPILLALVTVLSSGMALAADPFRTGAKARPMGAALQRIFEDFFQKGDYQIPDQDFEQAQRENPNEPLVYTLKAASAYLNNQKETFLTTLPKIREASEGISRRDLARSHLYRGLANGLEGYYLKDTVAGIPKALTYASSMLLELDKARRLAPNDPEINLFVGYVNMVLGKREEALANFQKAEPVYLSYRGKALIYRDTNELDKAMEAVEQAMAAAPQNPELFYLKAQILGKQQKPTEAIAWFDKALEQGTQLPEGIRKQITKERESHRARAALK